MEVSPRARPNACHYCDQRHLLYGEWEECARSRHIPDRLPDDIVLALLADK